MILEVNFLRRKAEQLPAVTHPSFGEWLLLQFTAGRPTAGLPFAEVEGLCAKTSSLLIGAAFSGRATGLEASFDAGSRDEAAVLARRTADGFKASLEDRQDTVLAWPWDHLATSAAWQAAKDNDLSERTLGDAMLRLGVTYAALYREQLTAVLDLWAQVAAAVRREPTPDLASMGAGMFEAYARTFAPS